MMGSEQTIKTTALVVGGGMVGATLAIGLAQQGKHVVVLEPSQAQPFIVGSDYDLRISAITSDNIQLLEELAIWPQVRALRVFPFYQLAVSDTAQSWLELGEENASSPLGYMVENKVLQYALRQELENYSNIHYLESSLAELNFSDCSNINEAVTATGVTIQFDWVFGCDGGQSFVRQASGIGVAGRDYGQSCLLSIVKTKQQVPMRTWELFQGDEIHALLPLADHFACCILYASSAQVKQWQQSTEQLNQELQTRFQSHIGEFNLVKQGSFPLRRQSALRYVQQPTILLGDAAHTIHPLAGQGVNLGFRDVKALLKAVTNHDLDSYDNNKKLQRALRQYERARRLDNELMAHAMDAINWGFKQEQPLFRILRSALLTGLQDVDLGRRLLAAYASGVWKINKE